MARQEAIDKIKRNEEEQQQQKGETKDEETKTKPEVIARYLKQHLGTTKLNGTSLYPSNMTDARDQCIVRNRIRVELEYNGDVPPEGKKIKTRARSVCVLIFVY
jgi:hypothetical protein